MPGVTPNGSTNLAFVDSKAVANLCDGNFYVDVTPSTYLASGLEDNVIGARVRIINPYSVVIKDYADTPEISPGLSGGMSGIVSFPIPTQAGAYQTGQYTILVEMEDQDGTKWTVTKTIRICSPDKSNTSRKYGTLSAMMKANCKTGKLFIVVDNVPTYNGFVSTSKTLSADLEYPTSSEIPVLNVTDGNFSVTLFEGVYKISGEICALYSFGDNVFAYVKYKVKKEHNVRCLIDDCCILSKLVDLHAQLNTSCTEEQKNELASITVDALRLYETIKLAANCCEDPSEYVEDLEKLLGCKCTCNCADGAPIIGTDPSNDIVIEGCNIEESQSGNTKTYTINNYSYEVNVNNNNGVLSVQSVTTDGCKVTTVLAFSISAAYSQIKNLANDSNDEGDFWASVVNKSLRSVDPADLGLSQVSWDAKTFPEKVQAIIDKIQSCCSECEATIVNPTLTKSGNDVVIKWTGSAAFYEVYIDGVLYNTVLSTSANPTTGEFTNVFQGYADGYSHEWVILAYCGTKNLGQNEDGTFQMLGCPLVSPTEFTSDVSSSGTVTGALCPFDLTSLIHISNPHTVEWHTANNTDAGTLVSSPASVSSGAYYAFNKNADGCYSVGQKVTVICDTETSCTAPQNLTVGVFGSSNFFVQFQSAAYPPSGGYRVYRRLATDPDVGGSYTLIGTPVWNASLQRWVIDDISGVTNTPYVYKAVSMCGATEPYITYTYAAVACPTVTFTESDTSVDYSLPSVSGAVQIFVKLYDSSGLILIKTDTYTPPYASPIEGTFEYLSPETTYKVGVTLVFGGASEYEHNCPKQSFTTNPEVAP